MSPHSVAALLPAGLSFRLAHVEQQNGALHLTLAATSPTAHCPLCQQSATGVHSRYDRHLTDLPVQGLTLRFQIRVRRFYCRVQDCSRRVFCERLPGWAAPHARQTSRLGQCLQLVAHALGGHAGARLAERLSLPTSATTRLRRLHRTADDPVAAPRVVGIDDWAYKRGQSYGTVLVDLEQRRVIDLLPDRTAETVAAWVRAHPGIEVVSRDRAGAYAEAVRLGAPQAEQVADRWHLLHNLTDAVQRIVERHHRSWRELVQPAEPESAASPEPEKKPAPTLETAADPHRQARRERQQARCDEVLRLRAEGVPIRNIANRLRMHRRTVRQWIRLGEVPLRTKPKRRKCELDAHAHYVAQRWAEGLHNAAQLWRELRSRGFAGSATRVRQGIRQQYRPLSKRETGVSTPAARQVSPRQLTWVLLGGPRVVEATTQRLAGQFREKTPEVDQAVQLAKEFAALLRHQRGDQLDAWLNRAAASGLASFAAGLRRDQAAVQGAVTSPWSQGQVEGHVNRLKMLKRQMYGRASFSLLRSRVVLGQNRAPTVASAVA